MSPMMTQYVKMKEAHPDCILMLRLGDFYEMFFEDAKTVSRELDLVLTSKSCGNNERAPMCGVPYHAIDSYLPKLIAKGYKVAICEQMEDPATVKNRLVDRDIIRIVSPGTVIESSCLDETKNNFICSLYTDGFGYGIVFADISTGEIHITELDSTADEDALISESSAYEPKELIVNDEVNSKVKDVFVNKFHSLITPADKKAFIEDTVIAQTEGRFGEGSVNPSAKSSYALSALMIYLEETQKTDLSYMKSLKFYNSDKYLWLDTSTRRNLELCESMRTREKRGSLLWVLDKTKTSAGGRLIRRWIEKPLVDVNEIKRRQDAVGELLKSLVKRGEITEILKKVTDVERLLTRLTYGTANARDLLSLSQTINCLPDIFKNFGTFSSPMLSEIRNRFDLLEDVGKAITDTIIEEPAATLHDGGIIKEGASEAVDELRKMMSNGKSYIAKVEQAEKESTGIKTLKIGYNKVFGYYIEVPSSQANKLPERYIRRQTLANGERFVTEELSEMESRIITAKERDAALEYELFSKLRENILVSADRIRSMAEILAVIDTLCSFASVADEMHYTCPEVDQTDELYIKDGRHPVVEKFVKDMYFVPNDCDMNCTSKRTMIITGPNMAGKSTYMRQVALITLMAQIGSFVPASESHIGVTDKIFTRVGASDDLSSGDSTFMMEMKEVAYILSNATARSLVIYDEIGRGTSTFDGMAIARAVLEYTNRKIGAKTLFATHYHELSDMEKLEKGVVNYNIAARKSGGNIIFLRKIVKGGTDDSYGIEVASLAGVPGDVVKRAKTILKELEESAPERKTKKSDHDEDVISFDDITETRIIDKLRETDINTITPIEAMSLLYELKKGL